MASFQLLKDVAAALGIPSRLGIVNQCGAVDSPQFAFTSGNSPSGYFAYFYPGRAKRETAVAMMNDFGRALSADGSGYRETGSVLVGGAIAYEYRIGV